MKRLIVILILIGIGAYITVQYLEDRRFNPPSAYDYQVSEQIDTDFYNPTLLQQYYKQALEVGSYARSLWNNDGIDVRFMDRNDFESTQATEYYNQLIVSTKFLEDKLQRSLQLKNQGYTNDQIKMILKNGWTPEDIELQNNSHLIGLGIGANGTHVWELQKLINKHTDSIPEDGIFNILTRQRLRDFQRLNDLYPSGEVDEQTLKALLK